MWTWSLAQELGTSEFPADERTTKALASQAEAMLFLIDLRLRDFGRVLRGELDPAALVTQRILVHADDTPTNPGEDVVFAHATYTCLRQATR
jgi:hypothetical protein